MKKLFFAGIASVILLLAGCTQNTEITLSESVSTATPTVTATVTATPTPGTQELFDAYTERIFQKEIALNTINLHYTLAYPENFGITEYEPTLGSFALENMIQSYEDMKAMKTELETFDYEELSEEQQLTYDIMTDYIETELSASDLLMYTEVLGPVTGYQAQLPVLLAEYRFRTVQDIEDYLDLVALVDELFTELVTFEQEKSKEGLFMSDFAADAIIDQCRKFIENPEENYMIEVFETEIGAFEGLSEEEKQNYIARNKELITTELVAAYQILIDGLEALKGTGTNDKGLFYFDNGKRYYEYLVRSLAGTDRPVEELMTATEKMLDEMLNRKQELMKQDLDAIVRMNYPEFCETEPKAVLEDLIGKISEDFPEFEKVDYEIKKVHPSMQKHMSPAFYLVPPVDDMENHVIYINESQLDTTSIYTTMAHEGFPGHLYQNMFTKAADIPLIRTMFSYPGYSEGWATYVEFYAYHLGLSDATVAELLQLNKAMSLGLYAYADMGIHYLGWDVQQIETFLEKYNLSGSGFGKLLFNVLVEEPANYLSYFIGYMEMENLRKAAEEAWGETYSIKKFHEAVLSIGPAPFYLLEERIKTYE